jgi:hypothetical protein
VLPAIRVARGRRRTDRTDRAATAGRRRNPGRNDRGRDIDNSTTGCLLRVDPHAHRPLIQTDAGEIRELDAIYVAQHLEHAYALTAHGSQGASVAWAGVVGHPEDFTREWAYSALSQARDETVLHVIAEVTARQSERDGFAPCAPDRSSAGDRARSGPNCKTRGLWVPFNSRRRSWRAVPPPQSSSMTSR